MSKIITTINNIEDINVLNSDAYIVGIDNLSVNFNSFNMEQIKEINKLCQNNNKELFVSINKNMHHCEIEAIKNALIELDKLNITGILYYDIAIVSLKQKLKTKTPLVWAQEHLTTNYTTCNFWELYGAKYALISAEITKEEIIDINANTNLKLIVPVFGYISMFVSKRHLVKNYLKTFNINDNSQINYIEKEGNIYPIIDNKNGTVVYSAHILNGLNESLELRKHNVDYLFLNGFMIETNNFKKIIDIFKNVNKNNINELDSKINNLMKGNTDKGFLYKETVYKVK